MKYFKSQNPWTGADLDPSKKFEKLLKEIHDDLTETFCRDPIDQYRLTPAGQCR